jgi:hypothetical protein
MTDTPTLAELLAAQSANAQALAQVQLQPLSDARSALADTSVTTLVQRLQAASALLADGGAKTQIGNALNVLQTVPMLLSGEYDRLNAIANPPAAPTLPA